MPPRPKSNRSLSSMKPSVMVGSPKNGPAVDLITRGDGVMGRVLDQIAAAAETSSPVLIYGESGTGKDVVATSIHTRSRRARRPFVPVNCAAFAEGLVDDELF